MRWRRNSIWSTPSASTNWRAVIAAHRHVTLYRGVNRMADHEVLEKGEGGQHVILLNNLSSFTCSRERACEFGDYILAVDVPLTKIFFHCGLLPGVLQGEDEFLVMGGVVEVTLLTL